MPLRSQEPEGRISVALAHSPAVNGAPGHPLTDHLCAVAELAQRFADPFCAGDFAYITGLWHDLGKFAPEFQRYLASAGSASSSSARGGVDHSTAGAQRAVSSFPIVGHLIAYPITGHHEGLLDGRADGKCLEKRLSKRLSPGWEEGLSVLPEASEPRLPLWLREALAGHDAFAVGFFVRMLFSCLVDADFLDTEKALAPDRAAIRRNMTLTSSHAARFFRAMDDFERTAASEPLANVRREVRRQCEAAANHEPGFFSLTVPTGGGKTLSSMAFALRHALRWNLRHIIYVLPFTTIIEQSAGVFRRFLGSDSVLEHHCNLDPRQETPSARIASENWDAPVVVTTTVQFYDSLFSNRPSTCRKLHRLACSVIILDEAQVLPVDYLKPCLLALQELANHYGSTIVLCTATQPAVQHRADFPIGLRGVREIVDDPVRLHHRLRRVNVQSAGRLADEQLCRIMLEERQVLCIVNTTRHARLLFERLGAAPGHFHLSARMCPAHRRIRLRQIRRALARGEPCRVVSTTVVEAGVDLHPPGAPLAMAGLDSIAQAAGRCNRHNKRAVPGRLVIFESEHRSANRFVSDTANAASHVLATSRDPLDLQVVEDFFRFYYWDQSPRWDAHHIVDSFQMDQNRDFPFNFSFTRVAREFHIINDSELCVVLVPWKRRGRSLVHRIRATQGLPRELLREAQAFAVSVPRALWMQHVSRGDILPLDENVGILQNVAVHYSDTTGLNLEAEAADAIFV